MLGSTLPTNPNPYFTVCPEGEAKVLSMPKLSRPIEEPLQFNSADSIPLLNKTKLLYHINKLMGVHCLCIPPLVAPDILTIAHGEGDPGFSRCYKIITRSWFIRRLTKLFWTFICHCPQCLALKTRRHAPYGSLQPIESLLVLFFTLTLDFILALSVNRDGFNALMSITCKFSKRITLIKEINTWSAEQWAYAFFKRLDLID